MRKAKLKSEPLTRYSPDVLERLPYWVREMLKMLDDVRSRDVRRNRGR